MKRLRVLFVGNCYYNNKFAAEELRRRGHRALTLHIGDRAASDRFGHGQDVLIEPRGYWNFIRSHWWFLKALLFYNVIQFHGMNNPRFVQHAPRGFYWLYKRVYYPSFLAARLLHAFGKKLVYTHTGCLDGVTQTSFRSWRTPAVCEDCKWKDMPEICSDTRNAEWGQRRNDLFDIQITCGANRADFNDDPRVLEMPQFYCLDPEIWRPDIEIPGNHVIDHDLDEVLLYHAVGNFEARTGVDQRNIKSTHIHLPLVEKLRREGLPVRLVFCTDLPNKEVRFVQSQADIFLEMLTYGWFGANGREALMLGKVVVCHLRPEWKEQVRERLPGYVEELPVVDATPETVEQVVRDLVADPERRAELGRRSRAFAEKWHSPKAAADAIIPIYQALLDGHPERAFQNVEALSD